jgi:hypothetical protein
MTVTRFTGTRSSSPKHFQLQIWAYQNVSLLLVILDYWFLIHIWFNSTMTEFTGRLHLKFRILTWHLMIMVRSLLQWILREAFFLLLLNVHSTTKPLQHCNGLVVECTFNKSVVPRAQVPWLARLLPILALSDG